MDTQNVLTTTLNVLAVGARKSVLDAFAEDARIHHIEVEGTQNMEIQPSDLKGKHPDLIIWGRAVLQAQKEVQKQTFSAVYPTIAYLEGFAPIPAVLTAQVLEWNTLNRGNPTFEAQFDRGKGEIHLKVLRPSFFDLKDYSLSPNWTVETRIHHGGYLAAGEYQFTVPNHNTGHFIVLNSAQDDCCVWQGVAQ